MEHGINNFFMNNTIKQEDWKSYYSSVYSDYLELKKLYPFSFLSVYPTINPACISIISIAADINLINSVQGTEKDFTGQYSKKIYIEIPIDYKNVGCKIYGAKWLNKDKIPEQYLHIYTNKFMEPYGYEFCVGTPDSFKFLPNVILENLRTADRMLVAYEALMTGRSCSLDLIAYSHGYKGIQEYLNNKFRYNPGGEINGN